MSAGRQALLWGVIMSVTIRIALGGNRRSSCAGVEQRATDMAVNQSAVLLKPRPRGEGKALVDALCAARGGAVGLVASGSVGSSGCILAPSA